MDDRARLHITAFDGPNPPLVFLGEHGFRAEIWRALSEGFAAEHSRLEVDLLPPSSRPRPPQLVEERRADASPAALAQALHRALVGRRQLGPFVLIGVGFGAVVAEEYAERQADSLLGVVLVNPPHVPAYQWRLRLSEGPTDWLLAQPRPDIVAELDSARAADPQAWLDVEAVLRDQGHSTFDEHRLPLPTLIVAGDAAPLTSLARVCELRRERAQLAIAVCNGAGHFPMLEAPTAFEAALRRFLADLRRHTQSAPGAWSYRPECIWPREPQVQPETRASADSARTLAEFAPTW